jgi:hypothetical protein
MTKVKSNIDRHVANLNLKQFEDARTGEEEEEEEARCSIEI